LEKDLGKCQFVNWAFEILLCQRDIKHSMDHLKQWMKPESVDTPFMLAPGKSYTVCEPLGVTAILGSWNFPLITTIMPLVAAIAAGNCVVLKPSEMSVYCSGALKQLVARNLDISCYKVVQGAV
jgi:aldehyde dehydrogenase (NAD+)